MGKQLIIALFSAVMLVGAAGATASAQAVIENTGPGSTNTITIGNGGASCDNDNEEECSAGDTCTVDNSTLIDLNIDIDQDANSGDADNNNNTTGGDASSGDATNETSTDVTIGVVNDNNECVVAVAEPEEQTTEPTVTEPETDDEPEVLAETDVNVGGGDIVALADTAGFSPASITVLALGVMASAAVATRVIRSIRI